MNRGLFGTHSASGPAACFRAQPAPSSGSGGIRAYSHPFGLPVIAQSILVCKNAVSGCKPGDFLHMIGFSENSTVNTVGEGFVRCDGSRIEYQIGNSGRQPTAPDGSGLITLGSNWNELIGVVGVSSVVRGGDGRLPASRRWRTPINLFALDTLYSTPNKLGRHPTICWPKFVCLMPDIGYQPGDEVDALSCASGANNGINIVVRSNEKVVDVRTPQIASAVLINAQTGVNSSMTVGKWGVLVEVIGDAGY